MRAAYLNISGVPTRVVTFGKWVEEVDHSSSIPEDIIICIPGNPGVTKFYESFLETLHEQIGYSVWMIGHAGHEPPTANIYHNIPELAGNERLYGLNGQIKHKLAFIETYVPKNSRIHFIGHSIGAYMILELLKVPSINSKTVTSYLLFPTIERLAESPNGIIFTKLIPYIAWILVLLSWIFTIFPTTLQSLLIELYVSYYSVARIHKKTIINFVKPDVLEKVFNMGFNEMELVKERDNDMIKRNLNKLKLYYGANDRWTPRSFYIEIRKDFPGIDAQICSRKFEHAFVLRHSEQVAIMIASWIRK